MKWLFSWFTEIYRRVLNLFVKKNSGPKSAGLSKEEVKIPEFMSLAEFNLLNSAKDPLSEKLISVVIQDGVCGVGKTTSIFQHLNNVVLAEHPDNRVIFISPYLDELHRVAGTESDGTKYNRPKKDSQRRVIYKPFSDHASGNFSGRPFIGKFRHTRSMPTKLQHFKELVKTNKHIVATHKLFESLDQEAIDLISQRRYHVVIDEEPVTISAISGRYSLKISTGENENGIAKKPFELKLSDAEINSLIGSGIISVGEERLEYNGPFLYRYKDFLNDVKEGKIIKYNYVKNSGHQRQVYLWMQNPSLFKSFKTCHLLTYKFQNSMLHAYFDINHIPYLIDNLTWSEMLNEDRVKPYHKLVTLQKIQTANILPNKSESKKVNSLSSTWLSEYKEFVKVAATNPLKTQLETYFKAKGVAIEEKMWTTKKSLQTTLEGNGYKKAFVTWNARATNIHIGRRHLAFMYNIYINPLVSVYIKQKGGSFSNNAYATSMLIQWVFRSALRTGKPINLLLAEERMYGLFKTWLDDFKKQYDSPRQFIADYPNISNSEFKPESVDFSINEFYIKQPGAKHIKNLEEYWKKL